MCEMYVILFFISKDVGFGELFFKNENNEDVKENDDSKFIEDLLIEFDSVFLDLFVV